MTIYGTALLAICRVSKSLCVLAIFISATLWTSNANAQSPVVRVDGSAGKWQLLRGGQPYLIRGVGGDGSWELLAKLGGNSVRTWGHDLLGEQLDQAHKFGLTVTAGIWLGQVRQGFDWADADSLIKQRETIRNAVLKNKDHPALLMWALGNEMEDPVGKNGAVWSEINNLARLGAVDALSEFWTGKSPMNRCPTIESLTVSDRESISAKPGESVRLALKASDPERDPVKVTWELFADEEEYSSGGDVEAAAKLLAQAIVKSDASSAEVKLPSDGGLYRVFATVRDNHGGAAIANVPVRVDAPIRIATGKKESLPLIVYGEATDAATFVPSGWMGDAKSIKLDPLSKANPTSGTTSLRCEFTANSGWGGVAWQHPAQDWGDQRGGFDLTGATRLVFHARGDVGGEEVTFGLGLIGKEKKYFDTAKRSLGKIKLTRDWQRFEVKLHNVTDSENLTRIKTGFVWTVASPGHPVVFYLDDIQWE